MKSFLTGGNRGGMAEEGVYCNNLIIRRVIDVRVVF